MYELPMFPLGTVLLPSAMLPLHVFEERYRALVAHCLEAEVPEFGVVLIERGHEVGGGDQRSGLGCVARIVEVGRYPDGRYALHAVGTRPIEVIEWLPDAPYPRAVVVDREEAEPGDGVAELHQTNAVLLRRVLAMRSELGDRAAPATTDLSDDLAVAVFQTCVLAPLGAVDRQRLLGADGPDERVRLLHDLLAEERATLSLRLAELGSDATGSEPDDPRG